LEFEGFDNSSMITINWR